MMIKALHMPRPPLMYHEMLPAVLHQLLIVLALVSLHKTHCTDRGAQSPIKCDKGQTQSPPHQDCFST